MTSLPRNARPGFRDIKVFCRAFARNEDGMVTIFACFMIFCMLMIGGIGVDMMRHEMERTRIQAVADRAVLAAADLDQTLDPEAVVRDYFAKSGMAEFVSAVTVDEGINYRSVTVDATTDVNTMFMDYFGVQELSVPAVSSAMEKINKVEISLILDISGSMADNNKMANLQDAAGVFVDMVLTPEARDLISISVVPYSEHVNIGPAIFNQLNINPVNPNHDYSHCVEIQDQEFNKTYLNDNRNYFQMQHFQWNYYSHETGSQLNTVIDTVCPQYGDRNNATGENYEAISAFSQDADAIKNQINQFKPRAGTSIHLAMKWGVALLDPSTRDIISTLAGMGEADSAFTGRPVSYDDEETLKTVVLMTDGQNDYSYRIPQRFYNSDSEVVHWANWNLQYYYLNYVSPRFHSWFYEERYSPADGDHLLQTLCAVAKEKKIVIWTIGFETTLHGQEEMRECASSESHFFEVDGTEITKAFQSIARYINQLRLIQ